MVYVHTVRSVNDVIEGSLHAAPMERPWRLTLVLGVFQWTTEALFKNKKKEFPLNVLVLTNLDRPEFGPTKNPFITDNNKYSYSKNYENVL